MNTNTTHMIQLVNMNTGSGSVAGHKAGCSDLKKLAVHNDVHAPEAHATKYAAWLEYNQDFLAEGSGAWDIDWKACANHVPAGAASTEAAFTTDEAAVATETLTRTQCIIALEEVGYTGPTSYLMPKLRQLVALHTN